MGHSSYSHVNYIARAQNLAASGLHSMTYTDDVIARTPMHQRAVHQSLEPLGMRFRESRDSVEHPNSVAVSIGLDVTGSMRDTPRIIQARLTRLMNTIIGGNGRRTYLQDPQIMIAAIGDVNDDMSRNYGALQAGQFESGVEIANDCGNLWLSGGGGGQNTESYELYMYLMARHTAIDCWERRQHRGYIFMLGDELPYPKVYAKDVRRIIGDDLQEDITTDAIVHELQTRYNVFFIIPTGAANASSGWLHTRWAALLGEDNVLSLQDTEAVCELIGATIGMCEEAVTDADLDSDLAAGGAEPSHRTTVVAALHGRRFRHVRVMPPDPDDPTPAATAPATS